MDIWKITTGFFAILAAVGFYLFFNANATADQATKRLKTERKKTGVLQSASSDASAFVNWYRISREDGLTAEDYEKQVKTLHDKFIGHFPSLAEKKTENETNQESSPPAE